MKLDQESKLGIPGWKAKFYPISAAEINEMEGSKKSDLVRHSLNKWIGARKENLEEFGLQQGIEIENGPARYRTYLLEKADPDPEVGFTFRATTCSLCERYYAGSYNPVTEEYYPKCSRCPLYDKESNTDCANEFALFTELKNPEPMIKILETALAKVLKEESNESI